MRILLFGPYGVLGRTLTRICVQRENVIIPVSRNMCDYLNLESVRKCVIDSQPDIVINAAGLTQATADLCDVIAINGLFPHLLLRALNNETALIHMSSAEVFSGRTRTSYAINDLPDPRDYQGRSKSLGEIIGPNVCVIRTNFLAPDHGFMKFVFDSKNKRVDGWDNALSTGGTVDDVSEVLLWIAERLLETPGSYAGIVHLATEKASSKRELIELISELFDLHIDVRPVYQPVINRSLVPTVILRPIKEALQSYVSDYVPNEEAPKLRTAVNTLT